MTDDTRDILLIPVLAWLGLLALLLASVGYAYLPGVPAKLAVALAIAVAEIALVGAIYMRLHRAGALVQVTAAAGVAWLSLLFIFSFADFLTR